MTKRLKHQRHALPDAPGTPMARPHEDALDRQGYYGKVNVGSILIQHKIGDSDRVWKRARRLHRAVDQPDLKLIDHFTVPLRVGGFGLTRGKRRGPALALVFQTETRAGRDAFLRVTQALTSEPGFTVLHIRPMSLTKNERTRETKRGRSAP